MPLLFSIAICALSYFILFKTGDNQLTTRAADDAEIKNRGAELELNKAMYFLHLYRNVLKTQNLKTVVSIMSDVFYNTTATMLKAYSKLGIRKEIELVLCPPQDQYEDLEEQPAIYVGGFSDVSACGKYFRVLERFVDTQTDKIIYERYSDKQEVIVSVSRGTQRTESEKLHCLGCGSEIDTSGEIFNCNFCGSKYKSDSFDWVIGYIRLGFAAMLKASLLVKLGAYAPIAGMAAIPLGLLSLFVPFLSPLVYLASLFCLVMVIYIYAMDKKIEAAGAPLFKYDPGESYRRLTLRVSAVIERLAFAIETDMSDAAPDLDPKLYERIAQKPPRSNYHILETTAVLWSYKYSHRGERQYLESTANIHFFVLTPNKQVAEITKKTKLRFYRNMSTKVSAINEMKASVCESCRSPLALTSQCKCKYCGKQYDMADYDWVLENIDMSVFDLNGAKVIPVPKTSHPPISSEEIERVYNEVAAHMSGELS